MIGQKVNKGDSCHASVSNNQKRKQKHAAESGRHYSNLKPAKKCTKLQITEVSHKEKFFNKLNKTRHRYLKSPGHQQTPKRDSYKVDPSRLLKTSKVRKVTKIIDPEVIKTHRYLKRAALSGNNMGKINRNRQTGEDKPEDSDEEKHKLKKQHKDLRVKSKSSKSRQAKKVDIDPEEFKRQIEAAFNTIKKRDSSKPLEQEEIRKHLAAIGASVSDRSIPKNLKKNANTRKTPQTGARRAPETGGPEDGEPEGTDNRGTGWAPNAAPPPRGRERTTKERELRPV